MAERIGTAFQKMMEGPPDQAASDAFAKKLNRMEAQLDKLAFMFSGDQIQLRGGKIRLDPRLGIVIDTTGALPGDKFPGIVFLNTQNNGVYATLIAPDNVDGGFSLGLVDPVTGDEVTLGISASERGNLTLTGRDGTILRVSKDLGSVAEVELSSGAGGGAFALDGDETGSVLSKDSVHVAEKTTVERDTLSVRAGSIIWNETTIQVEVYDGNIWIPI